MEIKRYELGAMDVYPVICNKTKIENNPFFQVTLNDKVDFTRLENAVKDAIAEYPVFGCTLKYKGKYYFETNPREFVLINKAPHERPLEFGDNTNGFLWQLCFYENTLTFEWSHSITDGKGAYDFFTAVICNYYGCKLPLSSPLLTGQGLESIYDKNEKGINQKEQPSGFKAKELPYNKRGYKTSCHILKAPMSQVLSVSKKNDASPASVLPPLFSMALRKHLPPGIKNRNVTCNVPVDCRGIMKKNIMQNFIISKVVTYTDKYDSIDFSLVSTIYRALIDVAVQPENIVKSATETVDLVNSIISIKPRLLQKLASKVIAASMKHTDSNFTFTYLGRLSLPEEVFSNIREFYFRSWHDFGECNIAAIDVGGTLVLNVCENYKDKGIVPDFISICREKGIDFIETEETVFEQANLRMKGI